MTRQGRFAATIGMFDGLHAGHRYVLGQLKNVAASRALEPLVLTFANHPLSVLAPERAPLLLMPPHIKVSDIKAECGIDNVEVLDFTPSLATLTARQFLERLRDRGVVLLAMGFNNTIGSDRLNAADAAALGVVDVVQLDACPGVEHGSSTAIRAALGRGDVGEAATLLGHSFEMEGTVVGGKQLGRTIGYPTANMSVDQGLLIPAGGVYAVDVYVDDEVTPVRGMLNIGYRPTVDSAPTPKQSIEVHLLDYSGNLYGRRLRLRFLRRLRGEKRFEDLDALRAQLALDAASARQ